MERKTGFPWGRDGRITGNSMIEEDAAGTQDLPGLLEIGGQERFSHVFKHTHADNFIEGIGLVDIPVITDLHAAAFCQSGLLDALLRKLRLWLAQRYAVGIYPIMLCGIENQSTPATADIQQPLTRMQAQFATEIL